jgi:hypothetical protein
MTRDYKKEYKRDLETGKELSSFKKMNPTPCTTKTVVINGTPHRRLT